MVNKLLAVKYKTNVDSFSLDVDLRAEEGIIALFGPSGCGKTTTLNVIAGLLQPTEGYLALGDSVFFDSQKGINLPPQKRSIGYVFQKALLFPHLTVAKNITFAIDHLPKSEQLNRLNQLVALLGVEELQNRKPHQLSGGQAQRVTLARALAAAPQLLLLDEPFSALDSEAREKLGDELRRIHLELHLPMVLVTHLEDEASRLADLIVPMDAGKIKS